MKTIVAMFCVIGLCSCEKNINFKFKETPNILVVDARIENNQRPVVVLSKSFDYFTAISPQILENSFVHNAQIIISDSNQSQQLKEYTIDSTGGYKLYYYSIDTTNAGNNFFGELYTSYHLKIIVDSSEYDASTTIPEITKTIDSLWWQPTPFANDSTEVDLFVRATDPPGLGNYVRYFTKTNKQPFLPGVQSVFDDELIDGTTYNIVVTPGIDRNNPVSFNKNFFHRGDTVTLKLSSINKATYEFWLTMEFAYQSIGNPFASPNKVLGNISNGALGAFCGYASQTKTIIIPK